MLEQPESQVPWLLNDGVDLHSWVHTLSQVYHAERHAVPLSERRIPVDHRGRPLRTVRHWVQAAITSRKDYVAHGEGGQYSTRSRFDSSIHRTCLCRSLVRVKSSTLALNPQSCNIIQLHRTLSLDALCSRQIGSSIVLSFSSVHSKFFGVVVH